MSRWAILVTDRQVLPVTSGNRLRILGILKALRELGWKVAVVGIPGIAPPNQIGRLVDTFTAVRADPFRGGELVSFNAAPFRRIVRRLSQSLRPSAVIAEYVWLAEALRDLPCLVRRIIDSHDVFHERTERFRA